VSECKVSTRHAPHGSPGDWWCVGAPKESVVTRSVEIPDAAVEAGALAYDDWIDSTGSVEVSIRAALVAARPLLGPWPLLDREAVREAACAALAEDLVGTLALVRLQMTAGPKIADAVMELARPMPTREQIAETLVGIVPDTNEGINLRLVIADALLALLNGEIKKGEDQ
jgi:hypothetical protein